MGMQLSQVLPWGRSMAEYVGMFALSGRDLGKRILGCADGPASFNAEMTKHGHQVISCDPVYVFSRHELRQRFDSTFATIMGQMSAIRENFVWDTIPSIEALGAIRMAAMDDFLHDFAPGARDSRYVVSALPHLAFADNSFDLALCSNFLFLYSEQLGEAYHHAALYELCRVASEVRVFPLLNLEGQVSPHLGPVLTSLRSKGFHAAIRSVPYEFLKGANEMLIAAGEGGSTGLKPVPSGRPTPAAQKKRPSVALE